MIDVSTKIPKVSIKNGEKVFQTNLLDLQHYLHSNKILLKDLAENENASSDEIRITWPLNNKLETTIVKELIDSPRIHCDSNILYIHIQSKSMLYNPFTMRIPVDMIEKILIDIRIENNKITYIILITKKED